MHLGDDIEVITCNSNEKFKYSGFGKILVDDNVSHGKLWESYGGTFIHHVNVERSIYELDKIQDRMEKITISEHVDDVDATEYYDHQREVPPLSRTHIK